MFRSSRALSSKWGVKAFMAELGIPTVFSPELISQQPSRSPSPLPIPTPNIGNIPPHDRNFAFCSTPCCAAILQDPMRPHKTMRCICPDSGDRDNIIVRTVWPRLSATGSAFKCWVQLTNLSSRDTGLCSVRLTPSRTLTSTISTDWRLEWKTRTEPQRVPPYRCIRSRYQPLLT